MPAYSRLIVAACMKSWLMDMAGVPQKPTAKVSIAAKGLATR